MMRVVFLFVITLVATTPVSGSLFSNTAVQELTGSNFNAEVLKQNSVTAKAHFVLFYKNDENPKNNYIQLAEEAKQWSSVVSISAISCLEFGPFCEASQVRDYPSIRYYGPNAQLHSDAINAGYPSNLAKNKLIDNLIQEKAPKGHPQWPSFEPLPDMAKSEDIWSLHPQAHYLVLIFMNPNDRRQKYHVMKTLLDLLPHHPKATVRLVYDTNPLVTNLQIPEFPWIVVLQRDPRNPIKKHFIHTPGIATKLVELFKSTFQKPLTLSKKSSSSSSSLEEEENTAQNSKNQVPVGLPKPTLVQQQPNQKPANGFVYKGPATPQVSPSKQDTQTEVNVNLLPGQVLIPRYRYGQQGPASVPEKQSVPYSKPTPARQPVPGTVPQQPSPPLVGPYKQVSDQVPELNRPYTRPFPEPVPDQINPYQPGPVQVPDPSRPYSQQMSLSRYDWGVKHMNIIPPKHKHHQSKPNYTFPNPYEMSMYEDDSHEVDTRIYKKKLRPGTCGLAAHQIEVGPGGHPAADHAVPWIVRFIKKVSHHHFCAGVLLKNGNDDQTDIVLTTASCGANDFFFGDTWFSVIVGAHHREKQKAHSKIGVKKFIPHPNYSKKNPSADVNIALVKLSEPVPFGSDIQPICLPENANLIDVNKYGMTTGWGSERKKDGTLPGLGKLGKLAELHQHILPTVPIIECERSYGTFPGRKDFLLCANEAPLNGSAPCIGDQGAPYIFPGPDGYAVGGLNVIGFGCYPSKYPDRVDRSVVFGPFDPPQPGVYVNVAKHLEWIKKEMTNLAY